MTHPNVTIAAMNAYNARIPFNAWLAMEVLSATSTSVALQVPWRDEFGGIPGIAHGGILASIIDTAAYMVLMAANGGGGPTVDMRVDYHRGAIAGETIFVDAQLLRAGATISTMDVFIKNEQQQLIASGRCVYLSKSRRQS